MTSPTRSGTRYVTRCHTRIPSDIGSGGLAPESPDPARPEPLFPHASMTVTERFAHIPAAAVTACSGMDEKQWGGE